MEVHKALYLVFLQSLLDSYTCSSGPCLQPTEQALHAQWLDYRTRLEHHKDSFYHLPSQRKYVTPYLNYSKDTELAVLSDEDEGRCKPSTDNKDYLRNRAFCPWHNALNYDVSRYPMDLNEARMSSGCNNCHKGGACEPLVHYIPVLRRSGSCDQNGYYKYKDGWHALPVAYICIPRVSNPSLK